MKPRDREFLDGAEAIARGALDAGCDFFAGYPITPASGVLAHMLRELPRVGGVGIQGEDEIASFGMCLGAALAGRRVMTATSGPGLSLYSESIGAAIMVEVPVVIVVVQRVGPATGAATTGAQGDVQFIRWGTSGGYPIIALCPTDVADCYHLTRRAFALAERFRVPVFLAADKDVVMTADTVAAERLSDPPDWPPLPEVVQVTPLEAFHAGGYGPLRYSASSHTAQGLITKEAGVLAELNRHLVEKIDRYALDLELVEADLQAGASTLLVSYGVSARAARQALRQARAEGRALSSLILYGIWPEPSAAISAALAGVGRVLVVELNQGQYRREVERIVAGAAEVVGVNRLDGGLVTPDQVLATVRDGHEVSVG